MDSYQDGFPHYLSKPSEIKEILIMRIYHVMKTYWFKEGTIGYKDDILNIEQDIVGLISSLPQWDDQLPIGIVQKQNTNTTAEYKDFRI
eukprot:1588405-Ditylum_brightwellii.AAC.1